MTTSNKVRHIHLWLSENTALSVSKGLICLGLTLTTFSLREALISASTTLVATPKHSNLEVFGLLH